MNTKEILKEIDRLKTRSDATLVLMIACIVIGCLFFLILPLFFVGIPVLALGIALIFVQRNRKKDLKEYAGRAVIEPVLREFIELESYQPNEYVDPEVLKDLSILPTYNQKSGSDLITGRYQGHRLELCDLLLQQVTSTGKTTVVITTFKGQLLSYSLGRSLNGYVEVTKRTAGKSGGLLKRLKNWGTSVSKGREFESVEMENQAFNEMFDVRAEDPETAFLVLTPSFMERLMQVNGMVETAFCFAGDRVYMAIKSDEDCFEVKGTFRSEADIDNFRTQLRNELGATLSLLDIIRKNEYLF